MEVLKTKKIIILCILFFSSILLASCSSSKIKVTLDANGGTFDIGKECVYNTNGKINQKDFKRPQKEGAYFDAWLDEDGNVFEEKEITKPIKLTARYNTVKKAKEYNIVSLMATLDVTIFSLNFINQNQDFIKTQDANGNVIPTYVWMVREMSFDWDNLPEGMERFPIFDYYYRQRKDNQIDEIIRTEHYNKINDFVKGISEKDKDAKFNFYVNDIQAYLYYFYIVANKLEDRATMTFLSDGTYTYQAFLDGYNNDNPEKTFTDSKKKLLDMQQTVSNVGHYDYLAPQMFPYKYNEIGNYMYSLVNVFPNTKWYLKSYTFSKLSENPNANENFKTFVKKVVEENKKNPRYYDDNMGSSLKDISLNKEKQTKLSKLYNIGPNVFGDNFDPTKSVVFLGTHHNREENFLKDFLKFTKEYHKDSKIYYKGHPATPTQFYNDKVAMLNELDIVDVNSSIPAELLFLLNPDLIACGYNSSTFMTKKEDKVSGLFNESISFSGTFKDSFDFVVNRASSNKANNEFKSFINGKKENFLIIERMPNANVNFLFAIYDLEKNTITKYDDNKKVINNG